MNDISLHIMDLVENSINADATIIDVKIVKENSKNKILLIIEDNGKGMSKKEIRQAIDPFYTTKAVRNIGLGLPLIKQNCEMTQGHFELKSRINKSTYLKAQFNTDHIDCIPIGNIGYTITTLLIIYPNAIFNFLFRDERNTFFITSTKIHKTIAPLSLKNTQIKKATTEYINNNIEFINF